MVSFIAGFVQFSCAVAKFSKKRKTRMTRGKKNSNSLKLKWFIRSKNFNIKTSTNTNPPNKTQFDETKGKVYEN